VVFLERPEVADVLRQRGLQLNILGQEMTVPSPPLAQSIGEALAQGLTMQRSSPSNPLILRRRC